MNWSLETSRFHISPYSSRAKSCNSKIRWTSARVLLSANVFYMLTSAYNMLKWFSLIGMWPLRRTGVWCIFSQPLTRKHPQRAAIHLTLGALHRYSWPRVMHNNHLTFYFSRSESQIETVSRKQLEKPTQTRQLDEIRENYYNEFMHFSDKILCNQTLDGS